MLQCESEFHPVRKLVQITKPAYPFHYNRLIASSIISSLRLDVTHHMIQQGFHDL
jgi:hypothetical protein